MSLVVFAENLLEAAASVVSASHPASTALARLYDRDRGLQYAPAFPTPWDLRDLAPLPLAAFGAPVIAQLDIDVDFGSAQAVTGWALINHNVTGVTVTLFGDSSTPPTTSRDSLNPAGQDVARTFASLSLRYWRLRVPAMAVAPQIGEFLLGAPVSVADPEYGSEDAHQGNVSRDESPGGYVRKTQRGAVRRRLTYRWTGLTDADWADLTAAFGDVLEGAKAFPLLEVDGTVRWVEIVDPGLARRRVFTDVNEVTVVFQEML